MTLQLLWRQTMKASNNKLHLLLLGNASFNYFQRCPQTIYYFSLFPTPTSLHLQAIKLLRILFPTIRMCMYAGSTINKEKIDSLWIGLEFCAVCGKQSWVQWCPFSDTFGMFFMCSRDGQWAHCDHPIWNSSHESFFNLSQFITLPLWHKKLN